VLAVFYFERRSEHPLSFCYIFFLVGFPLLCLSMRHMLHGPAAVPVQSWTGAVVFVFPACLRLFLFAFLVSMAILASWPCLYLFLFYSETDIDRKIYFVKRTFHYFEIKTVVRGLANQGTNAFACLLENRMKVPPPRCPNSLGKSNGCPTSAPSVASLINNTLWPGLQQEQINRHTPSGASARILLVAAATQRR
jgi:hypothetical protein